MLRDFPKVEGSVEPILSKNVLTGDFESSLMKFQSVELLWLLSGGRWRLLGRL